MTNTENFARLEVGSEAALWEWLAAHHEQAESVWLVTWKKPAPQYLSTGEVLDALIAHGWIDGIRRKHEDPAKTMQLAAPRKMRAWAQSYKDRAEKLRAEGRMHAAGEAKIAESVANGMWDFYLDVDRLIVPPDLDTALGADREPWDGLPEAYRRNILRWIKLAKTDATRAKRIGEAASSVREERRIPQM
ncbi:MAG: YdeI/OmpD-associated family protein [Shimia sp.]